MRNLRADECLETFAEHKDPLYSVESGATERQRAKAVLWIETLIFFFKVVSNGHTGPDRSNILFAATEYSSDCDDFSNITISHAKQYASAREAEAAKGSGHVFSSVVPPRLHCRSQGTWI